MVGELSMKSKEKKLELKDSTIYQTNENCQVFNVPISGCVFAMPGATVNQSPVQQVTPTKTEEESERVEDDSEQVEEEEQEEKDNDLAERLKPLFYNNKDDVKVFLTEIIGMKPNDITDLVNRWVKDKRISDYGYSRKGVLWGILYDAGLYTKSRQNWNRRVF